LPQIRSNKSGSLSASVNVRSNALEERVDGLLTALLGRLQEMQAWNSLDHLTDSLPDKNSAVVYISFPPTAKRSGYIFPPNRPGGGLHDASDHRPYRLLARNCRIGHPSISNLTPWASGSCVPKLIVLVARRI
jgi:hypothetical protein